MEVSGEGDYALALADFDAIDLSDVNTLTVDVNFHDIDGVDYSTGTLTLTPEPATLALLGLGGGVTLLARRRRRK